MPPVGKRLSARTTALAVGVLLMGVAAGGPVTAGPRVASINACTDQLVLGLADRSQIATVSHYATDPSFSYRAKAATGIPVNHGHAEEVLAHDPDIVLSGPYTNRSTTRRLREFGYRVVTLPSPDTFEGIRENLRKTARLVGHPERGSRMIARMDRILRQVSERLPSRAERLSALALRPNGVTVGKGSLLDTLIRAAGLRNLGRALGAGSYREVPLEYLVSTRPDLLILAAFAEAEPSLAQGVLHHPVFRSLETVRETMWLPGRLWTCGGWFVAEAVARMAEHAYGIHVPGAQQEAVHEPR